MSSPDDQQTLQTLSEEYQKLQTGSLLQPIISAVLRSYTPSNISPSKSDLQSQVSTRQRLSSQQSENQSVAKEFSQLDSDSTIYKLVGPVLLKQERAEAVQAVDGRLEYIGGEV